MTIRHSLRNSHWTEPAPNLHLLSIISYTSRIKCTSAMNLGDHRLRSLGPTAVTDAICTEKVTPNANLHFTGP